MKITNKALILVFLAFFFYQASINTQSGWQYLITAGTISFILIGSILPRLYINKISVEKSIFSKLYACQPAKVLIKFSNRSNTIKKYVNFEDVTLSDDIRTPKITIDSVFKKLESVLTNRIGETLDREYYFINVIPPNESVIFSYNFIPDARGIFNAGRIKLFSNYPFGIISLSKIFKFDQEVVVYPKYVEIRAGWITRLLKSEINTNTSFVYQPTSIPASTRNLREYVTGDSPRHIHWPTSAKTNKLLVREFEIPISGHVLILLDSRPNYANPEFFELAVVTATSLLNSCHKRNLITRFFTQNDSYNYEKIYNNSNWTDQLELLARVTPVSNISLSQLIQDSSEIIQSDTDKNDICTVIVSAVPIIKELREKDNIINITVSKNRTGFEHYNINDESDLMVI